MIQYIEIILPYVKRQRDVFDDTTAALVIDNFKGQITDYVKNLLEANSIQIALLLPMPPTYSS